MSNLAIALVILSSIIHPVWNFLLKRGLNQEIFVWLSLITSSIVLLPLGIVLQYHYPITISGWIYILGTIILHSLYFDFLGRSYLHGNLSLVYPIARGSGSALVPILGVLILGEVVETSAVIGISAIVIGVYTVYLWGDFSQIVKNPLKLFKTPGTVSAILTGLTIAAYSLWDKVGVTHVMPFLYMYLMLLGSGLSLSPYIIYSHGLKAIRKELSTNATSIIAVGILIYVAYGLILTAFQISKVSYVSPAREMGIVVGVLLGSIILKEPYGTGRLVGSILIVLGVLLISFSP